MTIESKATASSAERQVVAGVLSLVVGLSVGVLIGIATARKEAVALGTELKALQAQLDTTQAELRTFLRYLKPEIDSVYQMSQSRALTLHFFHYGIRTGTPPRLLAAIAAVESNYEPGVVSRKGASGLLQVMPSLWWKFVVAKCGFWQRYDSRVEICAGAYVLAYYRQQCEGDYGCALSRYYSGAVTRVGKKYAASVQSSL